MLYLFLVQLLKRGKNVRKKQSGPYGYPSRKSSTNYDATLAASTQPQSLHFSVPTEFVELPSKGKYYPEGHPLKNKTSIEIKFMTAKEEDILASTVLIKKE